MNTINKFGDRISWENHVIELVTAEKNLFYQSSDNDELIKILKHYKQPPAKILDCGCNIGRWVEYFGKYYNYTGVDQSEYAIKVAKRLHPNNRFEHSLLWNMKFDKEFDIAITIAVLQHNTINEKHKILPRIYDAISQGGIYFMTESTVKKETETQLTYEGWIKLVKLYGFKFEKSWHKNEQDLDDHYIFIKQ